MFNPVISVRLQLVDDDSNVEIVDFYAADVLAHHEETRSWAELDTDDYAQESLAEDYALWAFRRRYGDEREYNVEVLDGLTEDE